MVKRKSRPQTEMAVKTVVGKKIPRSNSVPVRFRASAPTFKQRGKIIMKSMAKMFIEGNTILAVVFGLALIINFACTTPQVQTVDCSVMVLSIN